MNKIDNLVEKTRTFLYKRPYWVLFIFIMYIGLSILITYENMNYMQFDGIVEDVTYNIKGFPTIKISGKKYDIFYSSYSFAEKIERGDKMIKRRGNMRLLLIKPNSKDTIDFSVVKKMKY